MSRWHDRNRKAGHKQTPTINKVCIPRYVCKQVITGEETGRQIDSTLYSTLSARSRGNSNNNNTNIIILKGGEGGKQILELPEKFPEGTRRTIRLCSAPLLSRPGPVLFCSGCCSMLMGPYPSSLDNGHSIHGLPVEPAEDPPARSFIHSAGGVDHLNYHFV